MISNPYRILDRLGSGNSRHAIYASLHPEIIKAFGQRRLETPPHLEAERLRCIADNVDLRGATVFDIGANTGYFTLGAALEGAREVTAFEPGPIHAEFLSSIVEALGLSDQIMVQPIAFEPRADVGVLADVGIHLNVAHHIGADFGACIQTPEQALIRIREHLQQLARNFAVLVFQMGFNWKGDRGLALFQGGLKREVLAFIEGLDADWEIASTFAWTPISGQYQPLSALNDARLDALGEFANRPLFILHSKHVRNAVDGVSRMSHT